MTKTKTCDDLEASRTYLRDSSEDIILPRGWQQVRLGEITEMSYGYRTSIPPTSPKDGVEIISTADILEDGTLDLSRIRKVTIPKRLVERFELRKHDILFNWRNDQKHIGKTAIVRFMPDRPIIFASFIIRLRVKKNTDSEFLCYLLNHLRLTGIFAKLSRRAVNQVNYNANELKDLEISLPSLREQQKIADLMSSLDNLISKESTLLRKYEMIRDFLIKKLVTRGLGHAKLKKITMGSKYTVEEFPEDWQISELQEFCQVERGKFTHRPRNDPRYYGGKYPFIQTGDVGKSDGYIRSYSQSLNELGLSVSKLFPAGIIAITIAANIGATAITTFPVCFPDSIVGISTTKMNINYLEYYLRTCRKYLEKFATVNAQKNINLEILRPLRVPIPPREEQDTIASILSSFDLYLLRKERYLIKLKELKKAIATQLIEGTLLVKV